MDNIFHSLKKTASGSLHKLFENKMIFDKLQLLENSINEKVNYPIKWQRLETKRASRIRIDLDGGYKSSEEDWPAFHEIMIDAMNQLEAAIKPELKKLKI